MTLSGITISHWSIRRRRISVLRWIADKEWRMYKHDDYLADKERRTRLDSLKMYFETKEGGDG